MNEDDRLVTVCDKCLTASCWRGFYMCSESQTAGLTRRTVRQLREMGQEHSDYYAADPVNYPEPEDHESGARG